MLLVDPHEDSRLIYATVFRHHGFVVVPLACCAEALERARREPPNLVILALYPALAWDALRILKRDRETADIPVLAVSTTGLPETAERATQLGCAAILSKPLPPLELLAAARELLQSCASPSS